MARITEEDVRHVVGVFGIDTGFEEVGPIGGGHAYKARFSLPGGAEAYVVDSPEGAAAASTPELVGDGLTDNMRRASSHAVALMKKLGLGERAVLLHVLRGSPGYELSAPLEEAVRLDNIYIRVRYQEGSYRDHREREARAVYVKAGRLEPGRYTLVVADTVATGRSMVEALRSALNLLEFKSVSVDRVYIYGFISLPGARAVASFLEKRGGEAYFIAIENYSALSGNMYDMPLYGPDPARPDTLLGAAAPEEAVRRMLPHYYPGMDQPGDWSERQCRLFNGVGYERGDVTGHLRRSLEMLEELHRASRGAEWYRDWMEEVYLERENGLREALEKNPCK